MKHFLSGIVADVVDRNGNSVGANQGGFLVIKKPWPAMMCTIYGDPERFKRQYWSDIPGVYFTGDGARWGGFALAGDGARAVGDRGSDMPMASARAIT